MSWEPGAGDRRRLASVDNDEQRRELFEQHPLLRRPQTVRWICREAARQLAVDLDLADRLSATALWLAAQLADDTGLALARRAAANVRVLRRDYAGAVESFDAALSEFQRLGDDREAAITRSSAVVSLSHLGRHDRAFEYAAAARHSFRRAGDRLRLARLENNLAHILGRQDRFPEALNHYRRAYSLLREVGEPSDVAIVLRNIAVCYQDLNNLARSVEAYEQAREHCREHGLSGILLELDYNIAYLYYLRGEYTRAFSLFAAARRECEARGDHHHLALCDLDQAEIFLELNMVSDAARLAEKSVDGFTALGMEYEVAKSLTYGALAARRLGQQERAATLLDRARQLFAHEDNRVWTAMVDLFAALAGYAADRHEEAARLARQALSEFTRAGIPSRTALCEVLLARLALESEDLETARALSNDAIERTSAVGRPILALQAHLVSGQVHEVSGDREAALAAYGRAEAALERMGGQLATDELKIAFGDDKQAVYEGLVAISLESERDVEPHQAFEYAEKAKSRSLADMLAVGAHQLRPVGEGFEELDARVSGLREELNWLYRQLDAEELKGSERSIETVARLLADCRHREQQLLLHQRRLVGRDAELASLQGAAVADANAIAEVLPEDAALIEYYVVRGLVYAFLLDHRGLRVHLVAKLSDLRQLQQQLGHELESFRLAPDSARRPGELPDQDSLAMLRRLHEQLLAPLLDEVVADHLVVVPHDLLHHLPFHALHDGDRFLVDRFTVSYAPSATVFRLCSLRRARPADGSLILGVPDEQAPGILEEVRAVARRLPDSRLLVGDEVTPEALGRWGRDCRIIHVATHGLQRNDNPMFSTIPMGASRLRLIDLYGMRLEAELAVVSGCGTGVTVAGGADELVGLTRGLLHAGARAVMTTLWDVHEESTAELMEAFYGHLLESQRPADALRLAQLELRERYPHPYHWAPFLLVGRPWPASGGA